METSVLRKRVADTIEKARRAAAERRVRSDEGARAFGVFIDTIAVPLFKQVANVLRASGYAFTVFTPAGTVRLMSDKRSEDYVELTLDTSGDHPLVIGKSSRSHGRNIIEREQSIAELSVEHLTEDHVLNYLLKEIEPFVER